MRLSSVNKLYTSLKKYSRLSSKRIRFLGAYNMNTIILKYIKLFLSASNKMIINKIMPEYTKFLDVVVKESSKLRVQKTLWPIFSDDMLIRTSYSNMMIELQMVYIKPKIRVDVAL